MSQGVWWPPGALKNKEMNSFLKLSATKTVLLPDEGILAQ